MTTAELLDSELQVEAATTRRMLERVSRASLGWKPHAKSRSLGEVAAHIANIPGIFLASLVADELDRTTYGAGAPSDDAAAIVETFDRNVAKAIDAVGSLSDEEFLKPWRYRYGEQVIFQLPRLAVSRAMGLNHMVHHRGQLSVYLRLLDIPLPAVYGPTADEALGA